MSQARFSGLRGRFLLLVIAIFVGVGALAAIGFVRVADGIIHSLGTGYATQYANQSRSRILARIQRELVLAQKLVDSPLLKRWAQHEADPELTRLSLAELDSYRKLFADRSYFFVIDASRNYYFNNAADEFAGEELRYRMDPADPTMAWYFATMKNVENFDLHVDNNPQLGVTKVWINAVVRGDDGRKLGLGGSGLDLSPFLLDIVRNTDPGVESWLVDGKGQLQGHPDRAMMEANAQIKDDTQRRSVFDLIGDPVQSAALKSRLDAMAHAGEQADAQMTLTVDGRDRIAAISYLPEIHWATIVVVDAGAVIRLATFRPVLLLLAAVLLATILLVSWVLNRLVLSRIARLNRHTRDVAAGRYDSALAVDRDDEIGELTASFNHMTATIGHHTQHLEQTVARRTDALQHSNEQLASSNRRMLDSIEYARLIQASLLTTPDEVARLFDDSVLLYLPRDVVGGDFHAVYPDGDDGFLLAVGDCTGHGVPGALMTMAARALLDRAVAEHGVADPARLLGELHRGLRHLLQTGSHGGGDNGLELALLHIAPGRRTGCFAAAKLALWIVDAEQGLHVVKGDRSSIGYRRTPTDAVFANQTLLLRGGERLYLFTDGILDQNGGQRGHALGRGRLADALLAWRDQPLSTQRQAFMELLANWQSTYAQRDDLTLLGVSLERTAPTTGSHA